jgi:hypothetical protein
LASTEVRYPKYIMLMNLAAEYYVALTTRLCRRRKLKPFDNRPDKVIHARLDGGLIRWF